ncbi:MAG: hypothetical protein GYA55_00725 [SAR324 cluster bacterium]|uniref:Uncharacterized protein n=1 Tax=SAR324 cluster bacterium TaxID=2024889 RepID=A0A7X9FPV4_9DELT|nr:hypothetical protein [SAR324 cluster bacterium]
MGAATNYLENKILDHILGNSAYSAPSKVYVGLATGVSEAGVVTGEPSSGSYARVEVTNNATNFPNAVDGSKSNGTAITFPEATGSWGTLTHVFISDASSGGNVLLYSELTVSKAVDTGDTVSFAIGSLTFNLD